MPTFFGENNEIINPSDLQYANNLESALKYEGQTEPKTFGGFSNNFRYKNFNLNIGFDICIRA